MLRKVTPPKTKYKDLFPSTLTCLGLKDLVVVVVVVVEKERPLLMSIKIEFIPRGFS
jgi:hypothetical protein